MTEFHQDTRGILQPLTLQRHVTLERFPAADLHGIVDWYWSVRWDLPAGQVYPSRVLAHPAMHLSVGNGPPPTVLPPPGPYPLTARVVGVMNAVQTRVLSRSGWNVAAKLTTGGFGALTQATASSLTDRETPLGQALPVDEPTVLRRMREAGTPADRAAILAELIGELIDAADPARVATARQVAAIAKHAEHDRSVRTIADLAKPAGLSPRSLQRLFAEYAGVSPTAVVRRYRLIDAAERVSSGDPVMWGEVAAELGYADQAHLTRDFTRAIGMTPTAYQASVRTPEHEQVQDGAMP